MAKLKCYSCPKCGSFLDVDRNQDTLDCPFCGSHFDTVTFHGEELSAQANDLLDKGDFKQAREKYQYLLSKMPDEFEFQYGYACALGGLKSLDDIDSPKRFNTQLVKLLTADPRYIKGAGAPYFSKLLEMYNINLKIIGMNRKSGELRNNATRGMIDVLKARDMKTGLWVYAGIHWLIIGPAIHFLSRQYMDSPPVPFIIAFWIFMPLIIFGIAGVINDREREEGTPETQAELTPYHEMNERSDKLETGVKRLEHEYKKAHRMLRDLKPESVFDVPEAEDKKEEEQTDLICKTCGAELELDKIRRLYVCAHCGASYDYELFVGNDRSKAKVLLKNREFDQAEKWFSKILADNPANIEALRGLVLCAGKWTSFVEISLNDKLNNVDWNSVEKAINDAIMNTEDADREYFAMMKVMTGKAEDYNEISMKLKDNADDEELIRSKDRITKDFERLHREFHNEDIKIMARINGDAEANPADEPFSMFSFRMKIIRSGNWISIDLIDPADPFDPELKDKVDLVILDAKARSEGEFKEYFEIWDKFVNLLSAYSTFKLNLSKFKTENEVRLRMNSQEDSYEWEAFQKKANRLESDDKRYKSQFNSLHKKLIELDTKLFFGKKEN